MPEADDGDEMDSLFDSKRDYLEQMTFYKSYQQKDLPFTIGGDEDERSS